MVTPDLSRKFDQSTRLDLKSVGI